MNIVKFVKPNVTENVRYRGEIVDYSVDAERYILRIYVTISKEPSIRFMKRVDVELESGSYFYNLCAELELFHDDMSADLDLLVGTKVVITLKQGHGEKFFINKIKLDKRYYKEQQEVENE